MHETCRAYDLLRSEGTYWALDPRHLDGLVARIERQAAQPSAQKRATPPAQNVALIPIIGPLVKRGSFLSELFGLASYDRIRAGLSQAVADRSVDRIVLFVDSPGGIVTGCEETAAAVQSATRIKPVVAYCDGLVASAAYWIASQANSITITPSGEAGSIGVMALHLDLSEALKKAGIKPTHLVSKVSPRKADLNPYQPIDPEAKARAQSDIDKIARKFVATVAKGRGTTSGLVTERFGQGDCLLADAAKSAGMVDGIGSLEDAIAAPLPSSAGRASAAYRSIITEEHAKDRARSEPYRQRLALLAAGGR